LTVAIGVLAENGTIAIIGSDLRGSFPKLRPNEMCGKAWSLPKPFNCGVATAGILRDCQPFVDHLWGNLKQLGKRKTIFNEDLEAAIDDARFRVFQRHADWNMQMTYGLTLAQWHTGKTLAGKLDPLNACFRQLTMDRSHTRRYTAAHYGRGVNIPSGCCWPSDPYRPSDSRNFARALPWLTHVWSRSFCLLRSSWDDGGMAVVLVGTALLEKMGS